ncbi:MAG: alpha-glucosidase [Pyrinomonadaceae bacterium]|nr:alpha-glucosidase [Pyrinomonadaceae bacterium]
MNRKNYIYSFILLALLMFTSCQTATKQTQTTPTTPTTSANEIPGRKWWKEAVVYQIYPRSFKDSNGDGIGDLRGIIEKLDYIKSLGVDVVWLNPIYSSPNDDNGYDVSDYRNIMKDFGTMADFDELIKGLHDRKIKLVMDIVVNHSSDEHEWFKSARSSRESPYRDYYYWWNAEKGKPPTRYSLFDAKHDAWKFDEKTNSYYLHIFSEKQPDLNWSNPKLRQEVYDIMKFWAEKGTDGFRLDAFQFVAKDPNFPPFPEGTELSLMNYSMGEHIHDYLKEMNKEVFSKYDVFSVAEGAGRNMQDAHDLVDEDRNELSMAYAFEPADLGKFGGYKLTEMKKVFSKWDKEFAEKGWLSIFLANHDKARLVSVWGNDKPEFRDYSSKMLSTFLLTMRGTPYYYNGDELAMTNGGFEKMEEFRDKPLFNMYEFEKSKGGDLTKFLERAKFEARDNSRTPFQWSAADNAGFSTAKPWIKIAPNYKEINAEAQEKDQNSPLNYFRKLTKLRKENPVLVYGKYTLLDEASESVYAYTRELNGKKWLILLNFTDKEATANTGLDVSKAKVLLGNYAESSKDGKLKPYEAVVFELN